MAIFCPFKNPFAGSLGKVGDLCLGERRGLRLVILGLEGFESLLKWLIVRPAPAGAGVGSSTNTNDSDGLKVARFISTTGLIASCSCIRFKNMLSTELPVGVVAPPTLVL